MQSLSYSDVNEIFPLGFCQELSMFGALAPACLEFLLSEGKINKYDKSETVFSPGEDSTQFYVVLSGLVRFSRPKGEKRVYIRCFKPGEQIGFVGMIGLHERRGFAIAAEQTCLLEITSELFHQVCEKFPADFVVFLINITRELSREINYLDALCTELNTAEKVPFKI
ncbi:Crp/Fnr family transcriptional regulator [Neptunomonas qingdaonensis]|uniref:Cyclic nucleotide-binding domain-containing protein n=1 Tax=Neptunomonas qingdaonensis TaxID=1045558 RepID=A0A1I2N4W9_9GAMM|nr:cyclic nucleotide-binding domain-containing protein [Neptunomonas qingdaonensis]SFF98478.1 Cyclic nucleotide-binding domain-containing protein [Neptunomonas qingdaonensis]